MKPFPFSLMSISCPFGSLHHLDEADQTSTILHLSHYQKVHMPICTLFLQDYKLSFSSAFAHCNKHQHLF